MPHNPRYQFNDEAIHYGAALYARVVEKVSCYGNHLT
jgi:hypothetical protein